MSKICLDEKSIFSKIIRSGRLICSFILLIILALIARLATAQNINSTPNTAQVVSPSISLLLSDVDGDQLNDATIENKDVKFIISSKTGSISFYYLKGEKFEENLYPPQLVAYNYAFDKDSMKGFDIDTPYNSFASSSFTIEKESENDNELIVRVTSNQTITVDDNTPDYQSISLTRRFIINKEGYSFKLENSFSNLKEKLINLGNDVSGSFALTYGPGVFMEPYGPQSILALKNEDDFENFTNVNSLNEKGSKAGSYCGIGIKDQYFCVMMESDQPLSIFGSESEVKSTDARRKAMTTKLIKCSFPKFNLGAKETRNFNFTIYAGPLYHHELQKINRAKISDYGWLVKKMLEILRFFYSLIPNYGVAIILLTLVVRLILYPLTLKQTKEMAKMQKIQPKVKALQDMYRDDPQKMNEEIMKLYTKNHVNPLGGCLPLLLQLPIIMALFNTFRNAVELRKASFLWMSDLSKGDPYLILPITIAVLMHLQQSKATTDPQQRQAMAFMPVMMLLFTFSLPSGLLVYWFASSVLGLLQQLQTNKLMASMKED